VPALARNTPWRDLVVIHRLEFPFPVSYLAQASWGACLAATSAGQLLDMPVLLAILANLVLVTSGLALNVAVDVRTDSRHQDKHYLASAVTRLGRDRVLRWVVGETVAGLALATVVSVWTGHWIVAGSAVVIVGLHLLYNVEPVRLKRRGFAGVAVFGLSVVTMPCLLSYGAIRPTVDAPVWLIAAGLGVMAVGRTVWWSVPDRAADTATGMVTPAVRHGAGRALAAACLLMAAGLVLLGWGLWWRYGLAWALLGTAMYGVFLGNALTLFRREVPSAVRLRTRALPLIMVGDVLVALIALTAG
jgi:4-hydroxybenzoate polyprenyltransferase